MYQLKSLEDTIVAIATPLGQGGLGIIRLSGKKALAIADQLFVAKNNQKPSEFENFTVHYGWIVDKNETLDEVLLTVMHAPRTYTKEDVVEMSCHGGMVVLRAIAAMVIRLGARLAEPGEFTKRAFLNGRIDLTQAEAVLDIIQAKTDAFLRVSTHQLKGELSTELESIREQLMKIYVEIEAVVNFPEDEIDVDGGGTCLPTGRQNFVTLQDRIHAAKQGVDRLLASSEHGKILKDGIKIVICGKSNVGKSSLLNVLLKTPRAIVSEIAGTTRDTIEETAQIKGIPFQLVDTAGILEPRDFIEQEAIKRSRMYIHRADLILLVLDFSTPLTHADEDLISGLQGRNVLVVLNKCDLKQGIEEAHLKERFHPPKIIRISALKKERIDSLETAIVENVWHTKEIDTHGILVSNLRHIQALEDCRKALKKAGEMVQEELSVEFVSEEIKTAVNFLDSITGRNIDSDLLDSIFSQFCIGK